MSTTMVDAALQELTRAIEAAVKEAGPERAARVAAEKLGPEDWTRLDTAIQLDRESAPSRMIPNLPEYGAASIRRSLERNPDRPLAELRQDIEAYFSSQPRTVDEAEHHALTARLLIVTALMRGVSPAWRPAMARTPRGQRMWQDWTHLTRAIFGREALRAFDTGAADEWVPTGTTSTLIRWYEVTGSVLPNLVQLTMTNGVQRFPFLAVPTPGGAAVPSDSAPARVLTEYTGLASGDYGWHWNPLYPSGNAPGSGSTVAAIFDRVRLRAPLIFTADFSEETAISASNDGARLVGTELRRAAEDAALNGSLTTGNQWDNDHSLTVSNDNTKRARAAWNGIRRTIFNPGGTANTTAGPLATNGTTVITAALKKMTERYTSWLPDLMMITSGKGLLDCLLGVSNGTFIPVSGLGPRADLPLGSVGTYLGIGVVLSEFQRNNLNTAGVFDNLTTDNTMHMIVNRQAWGLGTFRNVGVETARFAGYDQLALLGTWSGDMKKLVLAAELSEVGIVDVPTT